MQLGRVLVRSAFLGFGVPIVSYCVWLSAYFIGLGKVLDDWGDRIGLFESARVEFADQFAHSSKPFREPAFDFVFWDVLWVSGLIVLLIVALAFICRAFVGRSAGAKLSRILPVAALSGFGIPVASYFIWLLIPMIAILALLREGVATHLSPGPTWSADVLTVALINLPLYAALGAIFWMCNRTTRGSDLGDRC
jgi:hypothetical protein